MTITGTSGDFAGELSTAKILVVDDDERNLLALSEVLGSIATVVTANSGQAALRRLLQEDYAVILLDVFMPGLDGYETAALIREREHTARIPIIFLSAVNKEVEHLVRGYEMGAVDYVFKPVDPLILKSKVSVFVDLYNMRRRIEFQANAEQALREANYHEQLSRIEAERQLASAEQRQASVMRALPLAVYEAEEMGDTVFERSFVGGDLEYFLGEEAESVREGTKSWDEWVHPDDRRAPVTPPAKAGDAWATEYRWIGPDGQLRNVLDQRVEIEVMGDRRRWAGTVLDVSERKRLEAQLVHSGKLDALGRLTGGIAHDFNNLLAAMLGGIHVLQNRLTLGEREQRIINEMRHAAEQGAQLIRRMMAFARQQDLSPSSIEPAQLCESVAGLVSHALGGTVTINWECVKSDYNLFVDQGQLELALMNLIINARDAMPTGGEITVTIEPADGVLDSGTALRVRVRDEGVGIPPELLSRVTEPFFTTKEASRGTGLGLSMVTGFAQQSGGRIEISSTPGKGTTIDLILPATEAPVAETTLKTISPPKWLDGKSLMVIDDDHAVRIVLAEQLRDLGAAVEEFSSGRDAIAAIGENPDRFDIILSDFAMPKMDGLATVRELIRIGTGARAVLMTGFADDVRLSGEDEIPILRKPVDLEKLHAVLVG